MTSLGSDERPCQKCGNPVPAGETACPTCGFNPRAEVQRVALGLFLVFVVLMTIVMAVPFWSGGAPILLAVAGLDFGIGAVLFFGSFFLRPYRFGRIVVWKT
ncbi:MAG: hypothetical protein U5K70_05740 [Halodesulfurarchaeum sp.]|nr:hypothetical protein [Halodesulfurarchaeum sp.]